MILDHIGMTVSDGAAGKTFFSAALAPLGITVLLEVQGWVGMGKDGKSEFWFGEGGVPQGKMHIAFLAENRWRPVQRTTARRVFARTITQITTARS